MVRHIQLGAKECVVCGKSFQPASGAQKSCSPECKERARLDRLSQSAPRRAAPDQVIKAVPSTASVQRIPPDSEDKPILHKRYNLAEIQPTAKSSSNGAGGEPTLELDLTPLETYVRQVVAQALKHQGLASGPVQPDVESLRETIREIVKEEIAERLRGLFES